MKYTIAIIIMIGLAWYAYESGLIKSGNMQSTTNPTATIITNKGDIVIELYADKAPNTVKNFTTLASKDFYNDTLFHRVIKNFMIQGGDPNTRAGRPETYGTGGPGYQIPDEFGQGLSNVKGTISMANAGPNTGGSQFFINVADNTYLDGKHAVFGRVVDGYDVVYRISESNTNENDLPLEPVRIDRIYLKEGAK